MPFLFLNKNKKNTEPHVERAEQSHEELQQSRSLWPGWRFNEPTHSIHVGWSSTVHHPNRGIIYIPIYKDSLLKVGWFPIPNIVSESTLAHNEDVKSTFQFQYDGFCEHPRVFDGIF